jgi:hypothetical protein
MARLYRDTLKLLPPLIIAISGLLLAIGQSGLLEQPDREVRATWPPWVWEMLEERAGRTPSP